LATKFFLIFLLISGVCRAAPELSDAYREVIDKGIANGAYPAVAVGIVDGKDQKTFFFGKSATADSMFEIGAVSEVFMGLLVAQDAIAGKLRFKDTLRQLLPPEFVFTDPRLGTITIDDLMTHRSGLPAVPANFFPADVDDPHADYGESDLLSFLANYRAPNSEREFSYTTLDAGVLALLLARVHGTTYPTLLKAQILDPLQLKHTTFSDSIELTDGHLYGQPAKHWHYAALNGAAGLRTTLPDLLTFMQANLLPEGTALRAALLLSRQSRGTGVADEIGLGWNVRDSKGEEQSWPLIWRASETGGFSTFIGFRNDKQRAIVLLANTAEDLAGLGIAWLNDDGPPPAPRRPRPPDASVLATYPGLYQIVSGAEVTVHQLGTDLTMQLAGQPPWHLRGYDDDAFVANAGAVGVTFVRDIDHVSGLVLRLGNEHVAANRLSARAPRVARISIAVESSELARYAGTYQLNTDTLIQIVPAANGLTIQMTAATRSRVRPYAPDRFADDDGYYDITFARDKDGNLTGLKLNLAGADRAATLVHWR
jgi:serine-type D-Ala-D-Ala carboxypeptidase/endopeptidase